MLSRASVSLIFFLLAAIAGSRDIYVATNGLGGGSPEFGAWENAASNIAWAVNAGANGDTVWISNGTYYLTNQITVNSNITICGNRGELVVVDGSSANRCFLFSNTVNQVGVLSNLFITGGYTNSHGGGVYMYSGWVLDCVFSNNVSGSASYGGGIYFYTGTGIIQRCIFTENKSKQGGGMYLNAASNVLIEQCSFFTNTAYLNGGGLMVYSCDYIIITASDFICNVATNVAGGAYLTAGISNIVSFCTFSSNIVVTNYAGGLRITGDWIMSDSFVSNNISVVGAGGVDAVTAQIKKCLIARNTVLQSSVNNGGGGIRLAGSAIAEECIIENNIAAGANAGGGGVISSTSPMTVRNCLIRNNRSLNDGGGIRIRTTGCLISSCTIVSNSSATEGGGLHNSMNETLTGAVDNCIIYFNSSDSVTYSNVYCASVNSTYSNNCVAPEITIGITTNNITSNPQFVSWPGGNYRLSKNSPCINTGVNQDWMTGAFDLDWHRRIDRYSGKVDMGCYEYVPSGTMFGVR